MITWVKEGQNDEVQRLMDIVERYFREGDLAVRSIIYTDFLVTIIEAKAEPREAVKGLMGVDTKNNYIRLLTFYRELD